MMSDLESSSAKDGIPISRLRKAVIDEVDVTIETFVGKTSMTIAELNALGIGGIITLETALNDAVDLRVNNISIARGELVAVGDKFGVRITAIAP